MAIHEVTYYQAKCDGCGTIEDDYGDFSAFGHPSSAIDYVVDNCWFMPVGVDGVERLLWGWIDAA